MGFFGIVFGFIGFGIGISMGLVIGYLLFIRFLPDDVENPKIRPLVELDTETLQKMIPEIPIWVKNPDFDRADWLNRFLDYLWPHLDKAICKTAENIVKPIIKEHTTQYKIDSVEFETLTLGSLPPTFQGIKVYVTDEKELIIEPSIKWAGNPNITLAVKAFGFKATVQVVDFQLFAAPRITMKPLVPCFPCFANIYVSLMQQPHVDFGLRLVGADLMSIPGLYRFVQEFIKDQVSNMYLWPKTFQVQIMDPAKAARKPVGILNVKVLRAVKLKKKDILGAADPYVKLKLTEDKSPSKKTTVKQKTLNPEWNEEFNIAIRDPQTQVLRVLVEDWDQVGKHGKMGMNVVAVKDLPRGELKPLTLDLLKNMDPNDARNDKSRGQVVMELTYKPFKEDEISKGIDEESIMKAPQGTPHGGGVLVVIVHEAKDVEGKHHTNPYVKILLKGEKRKTKVVKKNRDPKWDEEFTFTFEEPPTTDKVHMEVISVTKSKMALLNAKESLGYVDISLADVVSNRRINDTFHLIDSKNGRIHIELQWRTQ